MLSAGRAGLFQMIEIEPEIVDRHLGGLIRLRRASFEEMRSRISAVFSAGDSVGRSIGEIHQLRFDRRLVARRHLARRRFVRAALRRIQGEVEVRRGRRMPGDSPVAAVSSFSLASG